MAVKKNLKSYLDALVDDEGLKTEVTINITNQTLVKVALVVMASGAAIVLATHLTRNWFPNHQLSLLNADVANIKQTLKKQIK